LSEEVTHRSEQKTLTEARVVAYHHTILAMAECETTFITERGNKPQAISIWREAFRVLFTLTSGEKAIKKEEDVVKRVREWLESTNTKKKRLEDGMSAFYDYQELLFSEDILKAGR